ncbi:helix-turn-helix domain-containing protein [Hungatella hominis]|nr:helix-turn-helix domain-containing protein [Hungatella hominis]
MRRLAPACESLRNKENSILNVAVEYGFGGHETLTRAFRETCGITPAQYRDKPVGLMNNDKPDLSLNYRMVDEGVPLIGEEMMSCRFCEFHER